MQWVNEGGWKKAFRFEYLFILPPWILRPLPPHTLLYYSRFQVDNKDKVSIFCTTYNGLPFSGVSFCFVFLLLLFSFLKGGELDKCLLMIIKLQGSF